MPSEYCDYKLEPEAYKTIVYGNSLDLCSQVPLTVIILIARYILEKYCFEPLGKKLKINEVKRKPVPQNDVLEKNYCNGAKNINLSSIAKKVEMSERQVERWWRLRRSQDKPSTLVKFTENMWKFTFYLCNFTFGLYVLWDKEWLWDMNKITKNVNVGVSGDIWWYYMAESSFYWSLTLTQFWEVRRKDFWQIFLHHLATIAMLSFSWIGNLYRISTVILVLHDATNVLLMLGKAAKSARVGGAKALLALFVFFTVTWVILRLMVFPYWILTTTTKQAYHCMLPLISLLTFMLWLLMFMNISWTWIILQSLYKNATSGKVPVDIRSSSSESDE